MRHLLAGLPARVPAGFGHLSVHIFRIAQHRTGDGYRSPTVARRGHPAAAIRTLSNQFGSTVTLRARCQLVRNTGAVTLAPNTGPFARAARTASRVSTLELLLDLVFVFTISQVARIVVAAPGWDSVARAAIIMTVVWWMYDAFAWLTNQASPDTLAVRFLLILAMAGFLVLALAIPDAFDAAGVVFGVSYLVVVLIHGLLFITHTGKRGLPTMVLPGPLNIVIALLLIASGFVHGTADWVLFALPVPLIATAGIFASGQGVDLGATHFVERHGLLMIIAFGESIVSVGAGLTGHEVAPALIVGAVTSVAVVAALWWCYFSGDDSRAEESFERRDERARGTLALTAFYLCHLVMILGLVLLAAGLHLSSMDAFTRAPQPAGRFTCGGAALYRAADTEHRRELRIGPWRWWR